MTLCDPDNDWENSSDNDWENSSDDWETNLIPIKPTHIYLDEDIEDQTNLVPIKKKHKPKPFENILNKNIEKRIYNNYYYTNWGQESFNNRKTIPIPPIKPNTDSILFIEEKNEVEVGIITSKLFDSWQNLLAEKIYNKNNILLNISTSCGKSWAVRKIITETILPNDYCALFVLPNIEI